MVLGGFRSFHVLVTTNQIIWQMNLGSLNSSFIIMVKNILLPEKSSFGF